MEKQSSRELETSRSGPPLVARLLNSPRQVLILDACGALATAFMSYAVLASELIRTGLPHWLLLLFAGMAVGFAGFDSIAYILCTNARKALSAIACLNLLYCLGVLMALVVYQDELTVLGGVYFTIEVAIVVSLASWEWILACR